MTKLNLGCGLKRLDGFVNVDKFSLPSVDMVADLEESWPWQDGSVSEIYSDNLLEHIRDLECFMSQAYRVLIPGGLFHGLVPYAKTDWAFIDPTHIRFFTEQTIGYWCADSKRPWVSGRFILVESKLVRTAETVRGKARAWLPFKGLLKWFFWNIYDDVYFKLRKPL